MKLTSVFIVMLFVSLLFLSPVFAEDYIKWELPEGAKMRLGKGTIKSYQFSPDNTQLAVMSSIGVWLYDVQTGKALRLLSGHTNVAFSPDWQSFAKRGKDDKTVEVWDLDTDTLKTTFEGHANRVLSMAYSPDGKMIASGGYEGVIWLWHIATGIHRRISTPHKSVQEVTFSPDGQTIMSRANGDFRLWDIATGEFKASLEEADLNYKVTFSPDGTILLGLNRLWDPDTGKIKMRLDIEKAYHPHPVFSPDGKTIARARWSESESAIELWDPHIGQLKRTLIGNPEGLRFVDSIAFSPSGDTLAVASGREIVFWDLDIGKQQATLRDDVDLHSLLFSSDGKILAGKYESGIYLWNIETTDVQRSKLRHIITGYSSAVASIAFSSDGQKLASGYENTIRLWNTKSGEFQVLGFPAWVRSVAFSPNGRTLASLRISTSSGSEADIQLWDAVTGGYQVTLEGHREAPDQRIPPRSSLAFSPNGEILASGGGDKTIRLWNAQTTARDSFFHRLRGAIFGHHKAVLRGHTDHVLSVAFGPDGETIASGSSDQTVRLWDVRRRKLKATFEGHVGNVPALAFSPDGKVLASGDRRGILLWDPITAKLKTTLILMWNSDTGQYKVISAEDDRLYLPTVKPSKPNGAAPNPVFYTDGIGSLAFSPDGKTLASATWRAIVLLDPSTLQVKESFSGHTDGVNSVVFSPDGKTLASGSRDGTVLIWELEP